MAAEYPGAIPTIAADKADATATATDHPAHHNKLAEEVVAIANELGVNPSGAFATVLARLAAMPQFKELSADASAVVGTTFADAATGLNVPVVNGVTTRFQFIIAWVANALTTGAKFSLLGPANTRLMFDVRYNTTATALSRTTSLGQTNDFVTVAVGTASDAARNLCIIEGLITPSASGDLKLRSGAEVASPGSVTVKAGSSVLYW